MVNDSFLYNSVLKRQHGRRVSNIEAYKIKGSNIGILLNQYGKQE